MVTFRLESLVELIHFDVSQTDWSTELSVPSGLSAGNYTVIISFDSESSDTLPDERFDLEFIDNRNKYY